MADLKAVPRSQADPKVGKPKPRSQVAFPYYSLDQSIEVARLIHERAGGSADRAQLAPLLGYSGVKNGGFLARVAAAKMFGVVEQVDDKIQVSERGQSILSPVEPSDAERAKVAAFMSVDLFKKVYDQFKGASLPAEVGLKNLLANTYKVVPGRVTPTVAIMMDSADQAGLFKVAGNGRMVMPLSSGGAPKPKVDGETPPAKDPERAGGSGGGNGGSGGNPPTNIPEAILGLLSKLPLPGTQMSPKKRGALIAAFTATVEYLYPDVELDESGA